MNCVFDRNNGALGSCFYSNTDSLNDDNYVIRLENSTFKKNTALKGGAIFFQQPDLEINTQQNTKSIAKANRVPGCIIVNCSFESNEAVLSGGAIYAQGPTNKITKEKNKMCTVNVQSSRFSRNIGNSGGDIYINYDVSMSVDDSTFTDQSNAKTSIKTVNSCNITISDCTFTMKGLLFPLYRQFLFAITMDSNITIVNTIFQAERSIASLDDFVMLTISKNVYVQVMNSTFLRANSILEAEHGATISIEDSTVVECFGNSLEKPIFSITNDIRLLLLNTEIKNNKNVHEHWAISAQVNCSITISGCIFHNNNFPVHVVAVDKVNVTVIKSQFVNNNNTSEGLQGSLIFLSRANATIRDSEFRNNVAPESTIMKVVESGVELNNCTLEGNFVNGKKYGLIWALLGKVIVNKCQFSYNTITAGQVPILDISSERRFPYWYLQIQDSVFDSNAADSIQTTGVADVTIQSSKFVNQTVVTPYKCTVLVDKAVTLRIADSLITSQKDTTLCLWNIGELAPPTLEFFTLKTNFSAGDQFLRSDDKEFWHEAKLKKLIQVNTKVSQVETNYSSRK